MNDSRTALLVGATGLIGGHCLRLLLDDPDYEKVITLGRRELATKHRKLEQHVIEFDRLNELGDLFKSDDIFCCLGTTIKKAGSQEAFRRVDFGLPLEIANLAKAKGATQFLLVSSLGADSGSRVFYSRVKGELELAISKIPFDAVQIFRPSLLLGERDEFRLGEWSAEIFSRLFSFVFVGKLAHYRPIHAEMVAAAMVKTAKAKPGGVNILESTQLQTRSLSLLVL